MIGSSHCALARNGCQDGPVGTMTVISSARLENSWHIRIWNHFTSRLEFKLRTTFEGPQSFYDEPKSFEVAKISDIIMKIFP
jgi:hypothetical protein